jgi:hypothetical protein
MGLKYQLNFTEVAEQMARTLDQWHALSSEPIAYQLSLWL